VPEGPEVENVRLGLLSLEEKRVLKASFTSLALKYQRYSLQEEKISILNNQVLKSIERQGKFIIWRFESSIVLNHLGMTGKWIIPSLKLETPFIKKVRQKKGHPKVILTFMEGLNAIEVIFDDTRNFGRFQIFDSEEAMLEANSSLSKLGANGLEDPFPHNKFKELIAIPRNKNKPLGELLLDSRLIPEIGNIYKSEILFSAKLHPFTLVEQLNSNEIDILGHSTGKILKKALYSGGSTINDFESPLGEGQAQLWHQVYARQGKKCFECANPIQRIVQKQRSTFFCSQCQLPRVKLKNIERTP